MDKKGFFKSVFNSRFLCVLKVVSKVIIGFSTFMIMWGVFAYGFQWAFVNFGFISESKELILAVLCLITAFGVAVKVAK